MSTNTTTSGNPTNDQQEFEQQSQAPAGRFANTQRDYSMADVQQLSGSIRVDHTLARHGADKLWHLLATEVARRHSPVRRGRDETKVHATLPTALLGDHETLG